PIRWRRSAATWLGSQLFESRSGRSSSPGWRVSSERRTSRHTLWYGCWPASSASGSRVPMLVREVLLRESRDRRAVARYAGLTGVPDESGTKRLEKGL